MFLQFDAVLILCDLLMKSFDIAGVHLCMNTFAQGIGGLLFEQIVPDMFCIASSAKRNEQDSKHDCR